ncbi:MAG: DUF3276 family protein [Spirochaetaceae bacterium]|jgi:hypothetical protein|nr:DUF3276 family protein [Spirochaetaceae bacterium]
MGQRGELFTRRIFAGDGDKTYFFNVKENRYGNLFLNLAESRKKPEGGFQRDSLMIYLEDTEVFKDGFYKALDLLLRENTQSQQIECKTQSGRRSYIFSLHIHRNGNFILITEKRLNSDMDYQHETIRLDSDSQEDFMQAFTAAMRFMENSKKKKVVKLTRAKK